jgi:integrase
MRRLGAKCGARRATTACVSRRELVSRGVIRLEITKSGRRREIPMRQVVYQILAAMPKPRQGRVWNVRNIRTAFVSAIEKANLVNFHFHDLRHSFASWFMMRGGSLQALKEILGHTDLKMTLRYAHLAPDHLRGEMIKTERSSNNVERLQRKINTEPVLASAK